MSAVLLGVAFVVGATPSGWGYAVGAGVTSVGLLTLRWRRWRGLTRAGLGLLVLVMGSRLLLTERQGLRTLRLPDGGTRLVNRLVEERDGVLFAARLLPLSGMFPQEDARDLVPAMEAVFDQMSEAEGPIASPVPATWLGLQSPEAFDAVVIPAEGASSPKTAVVFLHGFAGNLSVYCWQMARSARAISALTVCPSVGLVGDWWSPDGQETLKRTYAWLAKRGVQRVYLSGLSNGGMGASALAGQTAHPGLELRGLVLISGAQTTAVQSGVPMLLVEGKYDSRVPPRVVQEVAQRAGRLATYVEVDSGHFALLDRAAECEKAISSWLLDREQ
ncbi:alpha/beta hydrolase [Stigmatella sp. ncwal1]|uniref:Alpha/beta hydrolase n=1 Tax=Stigmatella ashevillensis TaxID=2995309 RepID=A0ABT5DCN5_9BACT|nr:alpha/beta hydrolase [Stigmatella ashevillena]MDC0710553.1 alpha/beta hydrolase [Stigmatella ashevillena]